MLGNVACTVRFYIFCVLFIIIAFRFSWFIKLQGCMMEDFPSSVAAHKK